MAQRLIITFRASMENQKEESRSQYDTTIKDLFEKPPQRLLQILIGLNAVKLLSVELLRSG
ncbi:MAG: hypothetical protein HQL07_03340 [Nitrospirae bacterium]|nr:hypothetical protein [Magnetococcales bacterium]